MASGVVISALVFAWQKSHVLTADVSEAEGVKISTLDGPLFFGRRSPWADIASC